MVGTPTLGWFALALAVCLAVPAVTTMAAGAGAAPAGSPHDRMFSVPSVAPAVGACAVPLPGANVSGSAVYLGGPRGGTAADATVLDIAYGVPYTVVDVTTGTILGSGCTPELASASVDASGSFSAVLTSPVPRCVTQQAELWCTTHGAPHGPVSVALAEPPADGYALSWGPVGPLGFAVQLVWELAYLEAGTVNGSTTVSSQEPTALVATAFMANGSPASLAVSYVWNITGSGWSILGPADGPTVVVLAASGASAGSASVAASARVNSTVLSAVPASVALTAVDTRIARASIDRTSFDVGSVVRVSLNGTGAGGLPYHAEFDPGLGQAPVALACTLAPSTPGVIMFGCAASYAYATSGLAQPSVSITNGFSSANWVLPTVLVMPAPRLVVVGGPTAAYAGRPASFTVAVLGATGLGPYSAGCLSDGAGAVQCVAGAGPSWTFRPVYPDPGEFSAVAWTVDAAGTNGSVAFSVDVVPTLSLGPVLLAGGNLTVGTGGTLSVNVTGGVLPARIWWNVSGGGGPWASGTIATDGASATTYLPGSAGVIEVSVTVVDGLGSVARTAAYFSVAPAPATTVVPWVAPPAAPVVVGTATSVAWAALDGEGNPARGFSGPALVRLTEGNRTPTAWVNASAAGPLAGAGPGTFVVPASAWVNGVLNLSIVVATAGRVAVALTGALLPNSPPTATLTEVADTAHLRLSSPSVLAPGARSNATFWLACDRFGNSVVGATVTVAVDLAGTSSTFAAVVVGLANGSSGVWINYTAAGAAGGSVTVTDAAGEVVAGPFGIPAAGTPPAAPALVAALTVGPAGAAVLGALVVVRHRRRGRLSTAASATELRDLAEGRETVVELLRRNGPTDLAGLEAAWTPPPAPTELAEWLASLVADGTLSATIGPDRVARFRLARGSGAPQVELDTALLEAALRRRDEDGAGDR